MIKFYNSFHRRVFVLLLLVALALPGFGQVNYLTTVPPYSGGNGSSMVAFNVKAKRKIRIKELYCTFSSTASQTAIIWYKTDSLNGSPTVATASGWIQAATVTFAPSVSGVGTVALLPATGLNITIPAGSTYALAISGSSITYTGTGSTPVSPSLIEDANIYINMGANVGYGGTLTSPIAYRQYNGKIGYEIVPTGPNNASTVAVTEPTNFCAGTYNVKARIRNNGTNQLSSVNVQWSVDGILQTSLAFGSTLDTFGGTAFPSDTNLTLGSVTFAAGSRKQIKVWTELPNGVADTMNADDTVQVYLGTGLTGTYNIGGATPNYPTLKALSDDASAFGLCGPVVAIVNPGVYAGKVVFNNVPTNATNTITVVGLNKTTCILSDSVGDALLSANNTSYVRFSNLTVTNRFAGVCAGISLVGNSTDTKGSNSSVANCVVNLPNSGTNAAIGICASGSATSGANHKMDSISIDSNIVNGGYYGIIAYGNTGASSSNNRGFAVRRNTMNLVYTYGIYMYYIYNPTQVLYNTVSMNPGNTSTGYGLYYYYCQNSSTTTSTSIIGNRMKDISYAAFYIYYSSCTAAAPTKIYNNTVYGNMQYSTNYGCYLYTGTSGTYEFLHNTMHYNGSAGTQYGLYYYNSANISGLLCKNNIFSIYSTTGSTVYPAYFSSNPTTNVINYNLYYNAKTTSLLYRGSAITASTFNTTTTGGDSSFTRIPPFASTLDLHLTDGCTRGVNLNSYIPTDLDGITRSSTPTPGAYEFQSYSLDITVDKIYTPVPPVSSGSQNVVVRVRNVGATTVTAFNISYVNNAGTPVTQAWSGTLNTCDTALITFSGASQVTVVSGVNAMKIYTDGPNSSSDNNVSNDTLFNTFTYLPPMSGTYTIGGTGADFPDFSNAFLALQTAGVNGPVNLIVNPGTYSNGPYSLNYPVYGVSATNRITIDGINAATRIVNVNSGVPAIKINQVSYVTLQNLTVNNTFAGTCAGVALIGNTTDRSGSGFIAKKLVVNLPNTGTSTSYGIIVTGTLAGTSDGNQWTDSVTIDSNSITGGYYGIQIATSANGNASYNRGHVIRYNTLNNIYYYGIRAYYLYNAVDIIGNTINMNTSNASSYGIYFYYNQNSNTAGTSKVIGNYVYAGYAGIYFYYFTSPATNPIKIYNNMFITYGASSYTSAYVSTGATGGGPVEFYHNSLSALGGSASYGLYYSNSATAPSYFKNNIFHCLASATYPAYFSTNPSGNVVNYNVYYNAAGGSLLYRGSALTAATYLSATGGGDSSFNIAPPFISSTNLRLTNGCTRGVDLTSLVSNDIDYVTRSNPPVIGAKEASSTINDVLAEKAYIINPIAPGLQEMALRIKNNKSSTITSMNVSVKVNNSAPVTIPWTGTLNGCDTTLVIFNGSNLINLPAGYNIVKIYTDNPDGLADANKSNDTITLAMSTISIVPGNAFSGNGTGSRNVRFASKPSMNTPNAFTVEAWVNLATPATNQKIVSKSSTTNGWVLGVQNGSIYPEIWTVANGTGSITLTAGVIPANTWTHLAMTWQSGVGLKAYVNGAQVGAVLSSTSTTNTPSVNDLTIGTNSWDFGHATTGSIDEVRVWNVALDSLTIRHNMHRTLRGDEFGLVDYVQLNEPSANTYVTDVISGVSGTRTGSGVTVVSSIPAGGDSSMIFPAFSSGMAGIKGTSLSLSSPFANAVDLAIVEVPLAPNSQPSAAHNLTDRYWIYNAFGNTGTFSADLMFTVSAGQLNASDTGLSLYTRNPYSNGAWTWLQTAPASSISAMSGTVMFNSITTLGQFTLASNGTSALPVRYTAFSGVRSGNDVVLNWATASETNNRGFAIERGIGSLNFEEINFIAPKSPNSSVVSKYSYTDVNPGNSVLYYRLRQVDLNGKYSYSPIVVIDGTGSISEINAYPNPFSDKFSVKGFENESNITVIDLSGKIVHTQTLKGNNEVTEVSLPASVPAGVYLVKFANGSVTRIMKQ